MTKRLNGCIVVALVLAWSSTAGAALSVEPDPLELGTTRVGSTSSVNDQIESGTPAGDLLDHIELTGATCTAFTVALSEALPRLVTPASPLPFTAELTPGARGDQACTVTMFDAANTSLGTFQLHGTAVAPRITVPASASLGSVRVANAATQTASQDLVIQNTGDAGQPLTITALQIAASDFVVSSAPMLPATLAPNESVTVGITFDPTASGTRTGTLEITSDDPVTPSATAALTGQGTNAVIGVTDVLFGTVDNTTTTSLDIVLSNTAGSPVGPLRVSSAEVTGGSWFKFDDGACAGATTCDLGALDITSSTLIGVRCTPPATATGSQTATVTFTSDTDPGGDSAASLLCTSGRPDLGVDKLALAFGDVSVGSSSPAQTVTVTNLGTRALTYTVGKVGAQATRYLLGGACSSSCTVAPGGGTQSFTVTFQPNQMGDAIIDLQLDTNDPDAGDDPFIIPVSGRGVERRIAGPAPLAFGNVEVGATSAVQPLVITNTGNLTLTITSATLVAGATDYMATGTAGSQTIAPGDTATWSMACRPQAQDSRPGTFRIVSNAANAPSLDVALSCVGTRGFLVVEPTSLDFLGVQHYTTATRTVTLRNTGNLAVTGITATVAPDTAGYTVDAATLPASLAAGGSALVNVKFAPTPAADGGPATATFAGLWGASSKPTTAVLALAGDGRTAGFLVSTAAIAFGDLRYDTRPTRTFCITNPEQTAVTIQTLTHVPGANTASSEFAVALIRKQAVCGTGGTNAVVPNTLAPGEVLEVTVRAQPANRLGSMAGSLVIASNLPVNPNQSVALTGNSTSAMLTLVPGSTLDFGAVDVQGAPVTAEVRLRNTGNATLELGGFARTASARFTTTLPATTTLPPNGELVIAVTYTPLVARAAGSEESITISHSIAGSLGAPPTGTIVVRGRGIDRDLVLGLTPVFPDTFKNPGELGPIGTVSVTNPGEAPLSISATMVSNDPEVWKLLDAGPFTVASGATIELRARFEPKFAGPAPSARIQITNDDDDDGPPITTKITEVMLAGSGLARNVQLNPGRFDVGYVGVDETITTPDALSVISMDPQSTFTINRIEIEGGDGAFAIEGSTEDVTLDPAATRTFALSFSPPAPGEFTARARLFLDLDHEVHAEVEVHGTAVFVDARGGGGCSTGHDSGGALLVIALAGMLVRRRRRAAGLVVLAGLAAPGVAAADDNILLSVFAPTPATTSDGFQLQSPAIGARGEWVASAVLSYATDPLLHVAAEGGQHGVITRSSLVELGGAVAVLDDLELGAHIPFYSQEGELRGDPLMEYTTDPASGTAVGDLTVHGKVQLVRRKLAGNGSFGFGGSLQLTLPTATSGKLTGDDDPSSRVVLLAALVPGAFANRLTLSMNAGAVLRATSQYRNLEQKSGAAWGLGTSVRVARPLWFAAEVFGDVVPKGRAEVTGSTTTLSPIEWLAGLRWRPDHRFMVSLAAGRGLTSAAGAPALRGVFAVTITPRADKLRPIHAWRPPKPIADADADGVPDRTDQCRDEAEDIDLYNDGDGCPELDNDDDGIADVADRCGLDPEDKDGFEDTDGCPDKDNDGDGLTDAMDRCVDVAEDKDGFADSDGCPELDNDGDGIVDTKDRCKLQPETVNGNEDDDGCPDRGDALIVLSADRIELLGPVPFQGGAKLAKTSFNVLGQVAAMLRAQPEILRIRVTCHVQPTRNDRADRRLSEARAAAVRAWLVERGIAPERLDTRGFGGTKPLVDPAGRNAAALNDRIELIIMDKK